MDTTPIHPRLWQRDFWLLAFADLLLTMTIYMVLVILPQWICVERGHDTMDMVWVMCSFALGLFALGPFCNYFIQTYRRHHVYMVAAFCVAASFLILALDVHGIFGQHIPFAGLLLVRFCQGAFFGLAQMILLSTLSVDVAESAQRTDANHAMSWFSRLAIVLGPLAAYELSRFFSVTILFLVMAGMALVAMILVSLANIPFKAPEEEYSFMSCDRFFLPSGSWLFFNSIFFSALVGLLLYTYVSAYCYLMLLVGFYFALRTSTWFLSEPKSIGRQVIAFIVFVAAYSLSLFMLSDMLFYLSFLFWGFLIGLITSQMSVLYIRVSQHCRRGTSQSTHFLSWELGVALGVIIAVVTQSKSECFEQHFNVMAIVMILFTLFSLVLYFVTLPWCSRHHLRDKV